MTNNQSYISITTEPISQQATSTVITNSYRFRPPQDETPVSRRTQDNANSLIQRVSLPAVSMMSFGLEAKSYAPRVNYGALPTRKKHQRKNNHSQDLRDVLSKEEPRDKEKKNKRAPGGHSQVYLKNKTALCSPIDLESGQVRDPAPPMPSSRPLVFLEPLTTMKSPNPGMRVPVRKSGQASPNFRYIAPNEYLGD